MFIMDFTQSEKQRKRDFAKQNLEEFKSIIRDFENALNKWQSNAGNNNLRYKILNAQGAVLDLKNALNQWKEAVDNGVALDSIKSKQGRVNDSMFNIKKELILNRINNKINESINKIMDSKNKSKVGYDSNKHNFKVSFKSDIKEKYELPNRFTR